ncbi:nitroreductase [Hydrogenophaga crassostreae]|uniref:Putative NAD(P)H nitroreductase n=1 Tax=Hydrogenophaga crassostreae TaxID=1763535 RepID=A0A167GJB7_9BURK|nr:nitroreductase [Hydrogenophaga crassostreae]AOW15073.1 nitroreductase [Hydrogenophaga crassostreae]OAD39526.1 nitroreductase [Hydrogenophaga crassostreae]
MTFDSSPVTPGSAAMAAELIHARRTVLPKRLVAPGPDATALHTILQAAGAAPDHGQLLPWRFISVPGEQRAALADLFAGALLERDPGATSDQQATAREKAFRAPTLLLLIVDATCGDPDIDFAERVLSAGCAVQNVLLMATAMGFGSSLTSGKALKSATLRNHLRLSTGEHAVCFVSLGHVASQRTPRRRPSVADYLSVLGSNNDID